MSEQKKPSIQDLLEFRPQDDFDTRIARVKDVIIELGSDTAHVFHQVSDFNQQAAERIVENSKDLVVLNSWWWFHIAIEAMLIWKVFLS